LGARRDFPVISVKRGKNRKGKERRRSSVSFFESPRGTSSTSFYVLREGESESESEAGERARPEEGSGEERDGCKTNP